MTTVPGVDLARLERWLDDRGIGSGPLEGIAPITGGTQNIVLRFRRGAECYVLRRPPLHKRANSDDAMRREARVLGALAATDVPHPALVGQCPDPEPLGAAFLVMADVPGANLTSTVPRLYAEDEAARRGLAFDVVECLARIASVDHVAVGLGDLGRPEGFLERQVPRWAALYESYRESPGYRADLLGPVEIVGRWLQEHRPRQSAAGLVHGDYHLTNIIAGVDAPGVLAVIDWEMCTIGDPLLDLGWLLATWPGASGPGPGTVGFQPWTGLPEPDELIAHYAARSPRALDAIGWYTALAAFKLGIVLEGTYVRALAGLAAPELGRRLHASAQALLGQAARVAEEA
jgi:aminoglycoside phosphotransferase (APT) family kinase protein